MQLRYPMTALLLSCSLFVANMAPAAEVDSQQVTVSQPDMVRININQADEAQLTQLKGIGPKKAQAIVAYRVAHGPFQDIESLADVKGISPDFVQQHRDELSLN